MAKYRLCVWFILGPEEESRKIFRAFVEKGIAEENRPDLTGGGL